MKFNLRFYAGYAMLFFIWVVFASRASNPPDGRTNAPFNGFCADCHSGSSSLDGTVSISGLPAEIEASQTYSITLSVEATTSGAVRAGFQMVSVFAVGFANAGDFVPNSSDEGSQSTGGREYIEHRGAKSFSNNTASWTFDWTAPDGPDGAIITMYYAGNITNGNSGSSGDRPRSGSASFTLSAATEALASSISSQNDVTCNGAVDGSATVTAAGGSTPYSYSWSNGQSTSQANNLAAGSYTVTVTDADGSMSESMVTISEPGVLNYQSNTGDVSCAGGNDGFVTVNPSGGTSPYNFSWSNGMSTSNITNLSAGSYTLTITDQNQCTLVQEFLLTEPEQLLLSIQSTHESSNMANDGTVMVSASGGAGNYSFAWNTGSTLVSLTDLSPGTYMVTVTDENQCEEVGMAVVQAFNCSLKSTSSVIDVACFGDSTGSITVTISDGVEPVNYTWSNNETGATISDLSAGMYDVTIQDAAECQEIVPFEIEQPDSLALGLATNHPYCPDSLDGSIMAIPQGGVAPYSYMWSNGDSTSLATSLGVGVFQITVTDGENCTVAMETSLMSMDTAAPVIMAVDRDLYLDSLGMVSLDVDLFDNGTYDDCSLDSLWLDVMEADCNEMIIEVLFSAMDGNGNADDTVLVAALLDTIVPWFSCIDDIVADSGQIVNYDIPPAFDNCNIDSLEMIEGLPSGSIFPLGETKVSYMATDQSGNIGCCSFLVTVGQTTTNVDLQFSQNIRVYPNPVFERLNVDIPGYDRSPVDIKILNSVGQQILGYSNLQSDLFNIDVHGLPDGIYFVMILREDQIGVSKILKK